MKNRIEFGKLVFLLVFWSGVIVSCNIGNNNTNVIEVRFDDQSKPDSTTHASAKPDSIKSE
jgi:hypothetical protein